MFLVFIIFLAVLAVWVVLTMTGWKALRWSKSTDDKQRKKSFIVGIVSLVFAVFLLRFHIQFSFHDLHLSLSWLFILPTVLSAWAVVNCIKKKLYPQNS